MVPKVGLSACRPPRTLALHGVPALSLGGITIPTYLLATAAAATLAFTHPYAFATDDAVSYLDIADACQKGQWQALVNGYWSPLYPFLLVVARRLVPSGPDGDVLLLRAVNFAVFLLAATGFRFFLTALGDNRRERLASDRQWWVGLPEWTGPVLGGLLFLVGAFLWIGLRCDTPDLCTAALFFAAAGYLLRAASSGWGYGGASAFGLALGLAFLSKTAAGPVALLFLACAFLGIRSRHQVLRLSAALGVFVLVTAPLVVLLTIKCQRFTIGESGRLNYAWYVNPTRSVIPNDYWQGGPPEFGAPRHPVRRIGGSPEVFEFAGPVKGTYAPWTDPFYWYDGLQLRFDAAAQWRVVRRNLAVYGEKFLSPVLIAGLLTWCLGGLRRSVRAIVRDHWPLLVPALGGLGLYLVATDLRGSDIATQPSSRYVAPFVVLLYACIWSGLRFRRETALVVQRLSLVTALTAGAVLTHGMAAEARTIQAQQPVPARVAQSLASMGLGAGGGVAILGRRYDVGHDHEYWARLARLRIVSHVPDDAAVLAEAEGPSAALRGTLLGTGARVLVYKRRPGVTVGAGWTALGETDYYACRLTR